jgi:hypothetical protein
MDCFLLQDWVTVQGSSAVTVLTQGENGWLDLSAYQDIVGWLDVKEFSATPLVGYQTSCTKDDALFVTMAPPGGLPTSPTTGVTTTALLKGFATPPLARWLRWQIAVSPSAAWSITFRIFIAANRIGSRQ